MVAIDTIGARHLCVEVVNYIRSIPALTSGQTIYAILPIETSYRQVSLENFWHLKLNYWKSLGRIEMATDKATDVRQVAFFGGQGCRATFSKEVSTEATRYVKSSSIASFLLSTCHAALLDEILASSNEQNTIRDELESFKTPESLISPAEQFESNPIIQGVTLCIHQLLSHLNHIESGLAQPFLDESSSDSFVDRWTEVVGYCSGVLPAAVIASSRTIREYIETSKEITRLAFWIGFRVSIFCEKLAGAQWRNTPWTAAVSGVSENIVGKFNSLVSWISP